MRMKQTVTDSGCRGATGIAGLQRAPREESGVGQVMHLAEFKATLTLVCRLAFLLLASGRHHLSARQWRGLDELK